MDGMRDQLAAALHEEFEGICVDPDDGCTLWPGPYFVGRADALLAAEPLASLVRAAEAVVDYWRATDPADLTGDYVWDDQTRAIIATERIPEGYGASSVIASNVDPAWGPDLANRAGQPAPAPALGTDGEPVCARPCGMARGDRERAALSAPAREHRRVYPNIAFDGDEDGSADAWCSCGNPWPCPLAAPATPTSRPPRRRTRGAAPPMTGGGA